MNTITDKSKPLEAAYCEAYIAFLNGERITKPIPAMFDMHDELAEVLRRQCRAQQHKQIDGLRPAVSFTEAEARACASRLREIAAALCELNYPDHEKELRVLAQKFDTWRKE